jgi:hypothetical protein
MRLFRIEKISFTDTKHMKTYLDLSVNRPDSSANKPGSLEVQDWSESMPD